jgi:hypothetical protein
VRRLELAIRGPRNRLSERPTARPLPIEPELGAQPVEPVHDVLLALAELEGSDNGRKSELTLAHEGLRVDGEPRLTVGGEDVVRVEILVQKHLLTLRRSQLVKGRDRCIDQRLLERPSRGLPLVTDIARPPGSFVRQTLKRPACRPPESRQKPDQDVKRSLSADFAEMGSRATALEEQSMTLVVPSKQAHCSVAGPEVERVCLMLALVVRPLNLQDGVPSRKDMRGESAGQGLFEIEVPLLRALCDEPRQAFVPGAV